MIAFALSFLAVLSASHRLAIGGQMTTPLQVQSIPMTPTDWTPKTPGVIGHDRFTPFDPKLGTLDGVFIEFSLEIRQDFKMIFAPTPQITTLYVSSSENTDPTVLANPGQLTDGPTVTLRSPDGLTPIFDPSSSRLPVSVRILTEPSGTFTSQSDPLLLPPEDAKLDLTRTLGPSDTSLLQQFIGTSDIQLPTNAFAHSSFYSDTGNGFGQVITSASATVKVQYIYTPFAIPEPSGLVLLGLGAGLGLLAVGRRHRVPCPGASDRM